MNVKVDSFRCPLGCEGGACIEVEEINTDDINLECNEEDIGTCSSTLKPHYCQEGEFSMNCNECGCPNGFSCGTNGRCVNMDKFIKVGDKN